MSDNSFVEVHNIALPSDWQGPVWLVLKDQIIHMIRIGALKPGQQLPTMRDLAGSLKLNRNTVQRVYNALNKEGFLETRVGDGTYVKASQSPSSSANWDRVKQQVRQTLQLGCELGLNHEQITALVREELERINSNRARRPLSMIESRTRYGAITRYTGGTNEIFM